MGLRAIICFESVAEGMSKKRDFAVRSELGIFSGKLKKGFFEASANGFRLTVGEDGEKVKAKLVSDSDRWAVAESKQRFSAASAEEAVPMIEAWLDSVSELVVEDYEDDVRYFRTPNGKVAYYAYNTHLRTEPVIFVHGGPGGDSNPANARRMKLDHPVYAYDQLGCGKSAPIKDLSKWDADDYADELATVIARTGKRKVILIGASWGAGLIMSYIAKYGTEKVAALVLPSPFLNARTWEADQWKNLHELDPGLEKKMRKLTSVKDYGDEFRAGMAVYNMKYLFSRTVFSEFAEASATEEPSPIAMALLGPSDLVCDGTLKDFDTEPALKKIDVPTLFMCGDSDEVRVETLQKYRDAVKGSRMAVVPCAGHVTALEQWEVYSGAVRAFLREYGL
jgi:proline iminopeptidase